MSSDIAANRHAKNLGRHMRRFRRTFGDRVWFNGRFYAVITVEESGQLAGTQFLPETLGVYTADADPRSFTFDAFMFHPYEPGVFPPKVDHPRRGGCVYHGYPYLITHIPPSGSMGADQFKFKVYAYRWINMPDAATAD